MPVMILIAFVGYVVNHFSALRFSSNAQIANTLGALAVGVLGNLYSRLRHGLAAAALLPAIFVQVPSGLAASGSLVSGVTSVCQAFLCCPSKHIPIQNTDFTNVQRPCSMMVNADFTIIKANQITNQSVNGTLPSEMTGGNGGSQGLAAGTANTTVLNVGYSMIQVAIGITVGLFLSALVVYPFGKRRSGLFSF